MSSAIFHPEFKAAPYWWEAWRPSAEGSMPVPVRADVAIVGGGYAGLAAALELARNGVAAVVLEANVFGHGASTRNGGAVSGGVNLGKGLSGRAGKEDREAWEREIAALLTDASDSLLVVEQLVARENIQCFYERSGRFVGAYTPKHYDDLCRKVESLNRHAAAEAEMLPRERQGEEIDSRFYHGGMVVKRSGKLHPALYYKGLLDACRRHNVTLCAETGVTRIRRGAGGFSLTTTRGDIEAKEVVIATNGYTGDVTPNLKRRVIPVASHIIATEKLPEDLARSLIPRGKTISDTPRILTYYRMSPDGRRVLFGGRARFTQVAPEVSAPVLHRFMTDRFPQLKDTRHPRLDRQRRLRLRLPAAYGQGRRHALRARLQRQRDRDDELSRDPDRAQADRRCQPGQCLRRSRIPDAPDLYRQSLVPAPRRRLLPHARPHRPPLDVRAYPLISRKDGSHHDKPFFMMTERD